MDESGKKFRYIISYILPAFLTIALFVIIFFLIIIPWFESSLFDRKREMIRELTYSAVSIMDDLNNDAVNGQITPDEARKQAVGIIRNMRYGKDLKDYFWITNMEPVMILNPLRKDLEGELLNNYKDPEGKALFMESVRIAREHGEGYIDYMWQSKDDSTRIVPKLSFVKLFKPWGWIIGTGIYIEDVKQEISRMKIHLAAISFGIILVITILLAFLIRQSLKSEKLREQTEEQLELSKEKYQALVETSPEGTIMYIDGKFVYANPVFLTMTGYAQDEIPKLDFRDLFIIKTDPEFSLVKLHKLLNESGETMNFEAQTINKDGKHRDVVIMASSITCFNKKGIIFITKDISRQDKFGIEKTRLTDELQSSLLLMNLPVTSFMKEHIKCNMNQTIYDAATLMNRKNQGAILITKDDRNYIGIVTDSDLRNRVLAGEHPFTNPVYEIMSSPLITIPEHALLYEAILLVEEKDISHLAVANKKGDILGIFSNEDLIEVQRNSISYLIKEIKNAETLDNLKSIHEKVPFLVKTLLDSGARIQNMTHLISTITDAITERVIDMAIEEMGEPPARFAFLALGSEGRREQTLVTDQDNAIIYQDISYDKLSEVNKYFLYFGQKINRWLDRIGYNYCKGEIMSGNPQWCQSISKWKEYFTNWITKESRDSSLGISIFFDFRTVYGDQQFAEQLQTHINKTSYNRPDFFRRMADNTKKYKIPVNIFKSRAIDSPRAKTETIDVKTGIMPVTDFARIYSLYHKINETNTLLRFDKIFQKGELARKEYEVITHSYDFLMGIRFKIQLTAILNNEIPENIVGSHDLTEIERTMIRNIFSRVAAYQTKLINDHKWS